MYRHHPWTESEREECGGLRLRSRRGEDHGLCCIDFGQRGRAAQGVGPFSCARVWGPEGLVEAVRRSS